MKKISSVLLLFFCCFCSSLQGETGSDYLFFDNVSLQPDASVVSCIEQDSLGVIWIGSDKGLYSYDGFSVQPHYSIDDSTSTRIYCALPVDKNLLYLGTDNGILIYNYKTDRYEEKEVLFPSDVRALLLDGKTLWIGSLTGLYKYRLHSKRLEKYSPQDHPGLPHQTVYSIIRARDGSLYIGTYDGLCQYIPEKDAFKKIDLPAEKNKNNLFVNSLLEDPSRQCIWVGTEGRLFCYKPATHGIDGVDFFKENSVKSLALDAKKNLLLGTDNGLYVYDPENQSVQHVIHDSRNDKSLVNNIIWNVFTDRRKNVWFGTDFGISLYRYNSIYDYIPIARLTGIGEGNRFYSMLKDSRENFWLGGTNGLIFLPSDFPKTKARWYRMGNKDNPLSHNRIRDIYEDRDGYLWIATDGGVNRFDYNKKQFVHYNITDSSHVRNSNWAYDIFEDNKGQLWIASCLGGIFLVNKDALLKSRSGNYIADFNYSTQNGLSGDFVNQIIPDKMKDKVWALIYKRGIDKINVPGGHIQNITFKPGGEANYIFCDHEGFFWVGSKRGIIRVTPETNETKFVSLTDEDHIEILSVVEEGDHLWFCTTDGIWIVNKKDLQLQHLNIFDQSFTSSFYDQQMKQIYLGGVDGIVHFSPDILNKKVPEPNINLTALYINNKLFKPGNKSNRSSIRYLNQIILNYTQNNLVFEFSDFVFSGKENGRFMYKLENLDESWNILDQNTNRISYANLKYGEYSLLISRMESNGKINRHTPVLLISIRPPWYYTFVAKCVYILILISLIIWTVNFFHVKNRLKIERLEKEKLSELSNLKISFFTDVSHEFKTPLSLILAPISKLLSEVKNQELKIQLEKVRNNALKLNALIHKALDFDRLDKNVNTGLLISKVEFIEFAESLLNNYKENYRDKNLSFAFLTNRDSFFINIDQLKVESVLNNLISNACKFSKTDGKIHLKVYYQEEESRIEVRVSDEGAGIAAADLPHVTERFYQSKKTARHTEGTGLGLYLVKNYIDMHGGKMTIVSTEGEGTTVTFWLPLVADRQDGGTSEAKTSDESNRMNPTVLIVEDNREIADFIASILEHKYNCVISHNGKTGLETCRSIVPDLIIADIMMPVMDGLEMCRQIKKQVSTSSIPIILLTAKDDKQTELDSINLNIDAFISKPFDINILTSKIGQLIRNKETIEKRVRMEALTIPAPVEELSLDEQMLSKITKIIEDKLADPDFNVEALSSLSGFHTKQMYRKLKQLTGLSTVEYIKSIRIKKAAMYLSQKKFTVAEVMYMVGFSNNSYFSKCFQLEFGKTPRQYMEEK